jgi:phospholipase C
MAGLAAISKGLQAPWRYQSLSEVIQHVVVVMMENRSFDHFLGWLPGADGWQDTVTARFPDQAGTLQACYHLSEPMGCAYRDPDHSYVGGRFQWHGGAMDNFARGRNDRYAIGFYTDADRPFMSALARRYTTCDRYFCSILGPTFPNRIFLHTGQTDRLDNRAQVCDLATIWDQLNQPDGPTGRYYFTDLPFLALWGGRYRSIAASYEQFLVDARAGALPNVAYLDPRFTGARYGTSGDDHPHAHIGAGDAFLADVFHALSSSPAWARTVLVVTYDEWGGFYDHVAPSRVTPGIAPGVDPEGGVDRDLVDGRVLLGFRVPCIVASPFTKGTDPGVARIAHGLYDHTSVLRLIEWRFGLRPLSQRDGSALETDPGNLADVLHLLPDVSVPADIPHPASPAVVPCPATQEDDTWAGLRTSGLLDGWDVRLTGGP